MSVVLVILVVAAKAPLDMLTFGVFKTMDECKDMAAHIDRSTLLILELSCKALA